MSEAVARWVRECAAWSPAVRGVHFGVATRSACRWSVVYSRQEPRNLFCAGSLFGPSSRNEGWPSAAEVSLLRLIGGHLHLRVLCGAPRLPKPSKAAVARTVERVQAYRSTNKPRRSVRLRAFPSSACRCGPLCRLHSLLHGGSLVSGPTGRLAWQCQKRTHAHVGLVTLHGAKRTQFGLDHCSLRM